MIDPDRTAVPEHEQAITLAHRILDRVNADPDDDLAVLARQLLRRRDDAQAWHQACDVAGTLLELPIGGYSPREFLEAVRTKADALERRLREVEEALRELVRLKTLHDRVESLHEVYADGGLSMDEQRQYEAQCDDYDHNKPLAWESARRLLGKKDG